MVGCSRRRPARRPARLHDLADAQAITGMGSAVEGSAQGERRLAQSTQWRRPRKFPH